MKFGGQIEDICAAMQIQKLHWQEEIGTDQVEWRGKVQLVTNGDVRYFRGWTALAPLLLTMLSELDSNPEPNQ